MKLATALSYTQDFPTTVERVVELEKAGLDTVWVAEPYGFDAISQIGYLAARTTRLEIATGIVNVYSRTAALVAMTAAGCDYVSGGRFALGLGASGAQVVEGFHGVAYDKPQRRIVEYIESCRMIWRREAPFEYHGDVVDAPLSNGGTGVGKALRLINHPMRADIPIWWASLMSKSVEATARLADGWLPIFFVPEKFQNVWGHSLRAGLAARDPSRGPLQIAAGGMVAIGEDLVGQARTAILDRSRPGLALYIGGMGSRDENFYTTITRRYGFAAEADEVQELYLNGQKDAAARAVPATMIEQINLVGPRGHVAERIAAYREAGVTMLMANIVGPDPVRTVETLRDIIG